MADMARVEQVKAETIAAELARLIAADVHWAAMRIDLDPGVLPVDNGSPLQMAGSRYGRLLRTLATQMLVSLEEEAQANGRAD
jgi:hypothetical protein